MKRTSLLAAAGLVALGLSTAYAQDVTFTTDQEVAIRSYVETQPAMSATIPADVTLEVGATLPATVELQPLMVPDLDADYQYVVVEGRTVIVDPNTRTIVYIIES